MFNWLLLAGSDHTPEITINSTSAWFQENGDEFIFAMCLGVILGIILAYIFYEIRKYIKSRKKDDKEEQ
ncbi:MAG: hypothetical protein J6Q85_03460 [Clostridia bacterium]|nr:hypothetical protein [Clostridia bacterium]